jgi:hypothetical protein
MSSVFTLTRTIVVSRRRPLAFPFTFQRSFVVLTVHRDHRVGVIRLLTVTPWMSRVERVGSRSASLHTRLVVLILYVDGRLGDLQLNFLGRILLDSCLTNSPSFALTGLLNSAHLVVVNAVSRFILSIVWRLRLRLRMRLRLLAPKQCPFSTPNLSIRGNLANEITLCALCAVQAVHSHGRGIRSRDGITLEFARATKVAGEECLWFARLGVLP